LWRSLKGGLLRMHPRVLIVGAGVAGSALGRALARVGIPAKVRSSNAPAVHGRSMLRATAWASAPSTDAMWRARSRSGKRARLNSARRVLSCPALGSSAPGQVWSVDLDQNRAVPGQVFDSAPARTSRLSRGLGLWNHSQSALADLGLRPFLDAGPRALREQGSVAFPAAARS